MRDERKSLRLLDRVRLFYVVLYWWGLLILQAMEDMRPSRVVVRLSLVQITAFIYFAMKRDRFFLEFAIFNFVLIGFAMSPTLFVRASAHWVKE